MQRFIKRPTKSLFCHPPAPPFLFTSHFRIQTFQSRPSVRNPPLSTTPITSSDAEISSKPVHANRAPSISKPLSPKPPPPLSILPFGVLLRSYLVAALCSSSALLSFSLRLLSQLANSQSALLSPNHNPLLRYVLKKTFYAHFCAGENPDEVREVVAGLKKMGYGGVILTYAKEITQHGSEANSLALGNGDEANAKTEAETWKQGSLETINLVNKGDFVALKFTGAGNSVVKQLTAQAAPDAVMKAALNEIFNAAKTKDVRVLIDAEQHHIQPGIDSWALQAQEQHNNNNSKAIIYNTYQAYLKSTPTTLAQHLALAHAKGFTLGIKLVRGAYLSTDPAHLFQPSKADTDHAFDGIAEALLCGEYNDVLVKSTSQQADNGAEEVEKKKISSSGSSSSSNSNSEFPKIKIALATHNHDSVRKAVKIWRRMRDERERSGVEMVFGQLMGMADEVSCELVLAGRQGPDERKEAGEGGGGWAGEEGDMKTFKYLPWGTVQECLGYLVRRAEENSQALKRAREDRRSLGRELKRRVLGGGGGVSE